MINQSPDNSHFIDYQVWQGGMINQLMSIEVAAGISFIFDRKINLLFSNEISTESEIIPNSKKRMHIKELIDIPNALSYGRNDNQGTAIKIDTRKMYVVNNEDLVFDINNFSENRDRLLLEKDKNYLLLDTLISYSMFFAGRSIELDHIINSVNFKIEYIKIAEKISKQIGAFNSIHVRGTDFSKQIHKVDLDQVLIEIDNISDLPVILSTDDYLIKSFILSKKKVFPIEEIILGSFCDDFQKLPISNEISLALVGLLLMTNSEKFVGTPKSTFSNYVHRKINQRNGFHNWKNINEERLIDKSYSYSWNCYKKISVEEKLWHMEWPESYLKIS